MIRDLEFMPGAYLGFTLSEDTRADLLGRCPPQFSRVICHHVTISFAVSRETLRDFQEAYADREPAVMAHALVVGDAVECVTVTLEGQTRRVFNKRGGEYHITLSVEPPAKPSDTNVLLASGAGRVLEFHQPLRLTGEFQLISREIT